MKSTEAKAEKPPPLGGGSLHYEGETPAFRRRGAEEGITIAQEALSACRPMVQGVYIMPPFGRIDAALQVLEAAR